jgi:hypothetical protein
MSKLKSYITAATQELDALKEEKVTAELTPHEIAVLDRDDALFERNKEILAHIKKTNPTLFKKIQDMA